MIMAELIAAGRRAAAFRSVWIVLPWLLLLGGMLWIGAGCDDESGVTFPPRPEPEPENWFYAIWGTGPSNVYVVGQPGLVLHYDGANWTKVEAVAQLTQQPLIDIWGTGPNDIYVCGHDGTILHYSGSGWSKMNSGTSRDLFGLGRFRDGSVYCSGAAGTLRKLSGGSWVDTPTMILRYNTTETAIIDTLDRKEELLDEGSSLRVVNYHGIGGHRGRVLMEDTPTSWKLKLVANEELVTASWSDEMEIGGNFLATEEGRLYQLRLEQGLFSWAELPSPADDAVYDIWTPDSTSYYFATRNGEVIRQSLADLTPEVLHGNPWMLYGIWGTAADNVYAVGIKETLLHFDGADWTPAVLPEL
jgi:hypothetical protein